MSLLQATRARLRLLFRRRAAEARMDDEFRFHIEMETEKNIRAGMSPDEARRQAGIAFGGTQGHREQMRDERGLGWLGGLSLDLKLGVRMLAKYPGLTIVGGLAMSFAIWVGAVTFELVTLFVYPTLPLPGGDRIVQIRNWDVKENQAEPRSLRDFLVWRGALKSVTDLGAYRDVTRNLIASDGVARRVEVAEVTASAFRMAPSVPLLGRVLVESDERAGAPPVVLLGHDLWQSRFASDPNVVGRPVRLGDTFATVVGVMPPGFAFPVSHELWMPLRLDGLDRAPRAGPGINVFGRLAPGVTLDEAQAELTMIGRRAAADLPSTHVHLQPRVAEFAKLFMDPTGEDLGVLLSINVFATMLVALLFSNVALLLFARAATRENELIVRSAIGASRSRIIAQLFAEALVLGGLAAAVGLVATGLSLDRWGRGFFELNLGRLPFWYDPRLSLGTVLYAVALTVFGATIAGVVPAMKVTRGLGSRLKQATAGGGGLQFGGVWTGVIVAQVAVTVAFPVVAFVERQELVRIQSFDVGFAAEEYLGVEFEMDAATASGADDESARAARRVRFGAALEMLRRRVAAEPGVIGVTFVDRLPRMPHSERAIELDESSADSRRGVSPDGPTPPREVAIASVDPSYFDVLEAPIIAGRGFHGGDLAPGARVVIVDQGFVDQVLLGRNPIGQRLQIAETRKLERTLAEESRPWYEIVGVVKELGMGYMTQRGRSAGVYLPASTESAGPLNMIVHVRGDPMSLAPKVRALATAVDATLRISNLQRLSEVTNGVLWILGLWLRITAVSTAVALLLSLAGIYAVLSFTVARRTHEIGVRVALGASRRRVVTAIFRRPLTQVGFGVVVGGALVACAAFALSKDGLSLVQGVLLVAYAGLMLGVCLLACVVPTRRALRVEPTVALRAE